MRSRLVAAAVLVAGLVALVLTAVLRETPLALTLGVSASAGVAPLKAGQEVCQRPIDVPSGGEFDTIVARVGTYFRAGSPLLFTVEDERGGVVARGRLAAGYPDIARRPEHRIGLDNTVRSERIAVCVRNAGRRPVAIYGNGSDLAARSSSAFLDGSPLGVDLALEFERERRSIAGMVPLMLERAALFRFPWFDAWAYVVLIILLVVAGPWLLLRSLGSATASSGLD